MVGLRQRRQQLPDHVVVHEVALVGDEVQPVERLDVVPVLVAEHGQDVDVAELGLLPAPPRLDAHFVQLVEHKVGLAHDEQVQQVDQDDEVHGAEQSNVHRRHDALQLHGGQLAVDPELERLVAADVGRLAQRARELVLPLAGVVGAQVGDGDGAEADDGQVARQIKLCQEVALASSLQVLLKQVLLRALLLLCVLYDLPPLPLRDSGPFGLDLFLDLGGATFGGSVVAVVDLLEEEVELRSEPSGGEELPPQCGDVHDTGEGKQGVGQELVFKE